MQATFDPEVKRRNLGVAGFLALLVPGLGQAYNAQPRKGVLFFAIALLLPFALLSTPLALSFKSLLLVVALIVGFRLYVIIDAAATARRLGEVRLRWFNRWYIYLGIWLLAVVTGLVVRPVLYELQRGDLYRIPTPAMSPTLLVGDYFVVDRWYYNNQPVALGDVVVFTPPRVPTTKYVMRCVATGGDTVEVRSGVLFVNNERAAQLLQGWRHDEEIMPAGQASPGIFTAEGNPDHFGPVVVPTGSYFLMGDTRDNSEDSRFFGPVAESAILGRVLYLYFSWDAEVNSPRFDRIGLKMN